MEMKLLHGGVFRVDALLPGMEIAAFVGRTLWSVLIGGLVNYSENALRNYFQNPAGLTDKHTYLNHVEGLHRDIYAIFL